MLDPSTDTARKAMLEIIVHGIVAVSVIVGATILAALHDIEASAWAAGVASGIAASGAVSVLQGKVANGNIRDEALSQLQRPGGQRRTDPPLPRPTGTTDATGGGSQ